MTKKVLIIGATSSIAEATARIFAAQGANLFLLARNQDRLTTLVSDLKVRGASEVNYDVFDANNFASHASVLTKAQAILNGIDIVLIAYGTLSAQKACEQSFPLTLQELNTNLISVISLLTLLANQFEQQKQGTIAVISSVAGDRGRQSNYIYGTAKGGLSIFLQGLRNRLSAAGVKVVTIKPGFVDTPMTAAFNKGLLWVSPEKIAQGIIKAIEKNRMDIYLPKFWYALMLIIKAIPEPLFSKLKL